MRALHARHPLVAGARRPRRPPPPPRAAAPAPGPASDAAVPEGHAGLHAELYGDRGADVHASADGGAYVPRPEDDGSSVTPVDAWLAARAGAPPVPGVLALFDSRRALQWVGASRDAPATVRGALARHGGDRVAAVRALLVTNKAMVSRSALQEQADRWLREAGTLPPGNGADAAEFAGMAAAGRTAAGQAQHDDRSAKLKKAMAVADDGGRAARDPAALRAAVEADDWSAVVDAQTRDTLPAASRPAGAPATPFSSAVVHRAVGAAGPSPSPILTIDAAEAALDEVRPYLLADGGDVAVVSVDGGVVRVRLTGACSTCASAGATLAMGVERALKAAFGDAVTAVERVEDGPGGLLAEDGGVTAAAIDSMLDGLRPAIAAYGGSVSVGAPIGPDRVARLTYEGPAPLATGIVAAVKDRFPGLADVVLE